jgi:hypothetical protein
VKIAWISGILWSVTENNHTKKPISAGFAGIFRQTCSPAGGLLKPLYYPIMLLYWFINGLLMVY